MLRDPLYPTLAVANLGFEDRVMDQEEIIRIHLPTDTVPQF